MDTTAVGEHLSVGANPDATACGTFDLVVLVSADHQHIGERFPCEVWRCPLEDRDAPPTVDAIKRAQAMAQKVAETQGGYVMPQDGSWDGPKNVLITCEEGLNRSLWVAAMVLVLNGEQETGSDAVDYLKTLRGPMAFENVHIEKLARDFMPAWLKSVRAPVLRSTAKPPSGFVLR